MFTLIPSSRQVPWTIVAICSSIVLPSGMLIVTSTGVWTPDSAMSDFA